MTLSINDQAMLDAYTDVSDDEIADEIARDQTKLAQLYGALFAAANSDTPARAVAIQGDITRWERDCNIWLALQLVRRRQRDHARATALVEFCPHCRVVGHSLYHHWEIVPHKASVQHAIDVAERRKCASDYVSLRNFLRERYNIYRAYVPDSDVDLCAIAMAYATERARRIASIRVIREMVRDDRWSASLDSEYE